MNKNIRLSNEVVTINGHPVKKIYGGFGDNQPCILAKQVAELHGQALKEINRLVKVAKLARIGEIQEQQTLEILKAFI
ncbi:MAG: hypothetical protein BWK80_36660 [Desulfobacteraceae bacterium IS3]|nr:MAG: hypothetical protein BWK80_36660 [Desulfobacteraceae bacterium IS3]